MEFRIDTDRVMRMLRWICLIIVLPALIVPTVVRVLEDPSDMQRIINSIIFMTITVVIAGLGMFFMQRSQKNKYMKCLVKIDDVGILIHDLTDTENYFTYEDIKYVFMGAKNSHALVVSHNKKCSTILNFTKDYQKLIDILKKKNVIFTNRMDTSESVSYGQRYMQGLSPTNSKTMVIAFALMGVIILLLKIMAATF